MLLILQSDTLHQSHTCVPGTAHYFAYHAVNATGVLVAGGPPVVADRPCLVSAQSGEGPRQTQRRRLRRCGARGVGDGEAEMN